MRAISYERCDRGEKEWYTHRTDADLLADLLSLVDVYFVELDMRELFL